MYQKAKYKILKLMMSLISIHVELTLGFRLEIMSQIQYLQSAGTLQFY